MTPARVFADAARSIVEVCRAGLDPDGLRSEVLRRLRRAVPVDALWWANADPATLLFTRAHREGIPERVTPYFVDNEFIAQDVNKWVDLARDRDGVRTLTQATHGVLSRSPRYLDVFQPLGLGDELRAALRDQGTCWGFLCLHREAGRPFTAQDARFVQRLSPHIAAAIRMGLATSSLEVCAVADSPGVLLLDADAALVTSTTAADRWLEEMGHPTGTELPMPTEVYAVAALLRRMEATESAVPRLRVRTRAGRWAVLHASRLPTAGRDGIAVVIEEASAAEVAPIVMLAYGLSDQERKVTGLVCQGASTAEIAIDLRISTNTVQDHLKSVFDKVGVRSRGELAARILREQYVPRARAGRPLGPGGFFA